MRRALVAAAVLLTLCLGSLAQAIGMQTVTVGDVGNQADTEVMIGDNSTGYGSVSYAYNMGKYEVATGQYVAFLNAVAATDTYGLYNLYIGGPAYGSSLIIRSGSPGSYTYAAGSGFLSRPVNNVSLWDAMRFVNWLHNGQPTGTQGPSTTEDGAYAVNGYNGYLGQWIVRKPGAKWFVPTEDEWYKAAYYKGHGTNSGYWDYPTRSDTAPGRDMADVSGNNANYYGTPYPIDNGKYTTVIGEFQNSVSPYGTFDQGGNIAEWTEGIISQGPNYVYRDVRGASFIEPAASMRANWRNGYWDPNLENSYIGFRVGYISTGWQPIPEPSSVIILAGGLGMIFGLRRRKP